MTKLTSHYQTHLPSGHARACTYIDNGVKRRERHARSYTQIHASTFIPIKQYYNATI